MLLTDKTYWHTPLKSPIYVPPWLLNLGWIQKKPKRAGLLHDIGKIAENETELPHAILGMKLAEKFKEKPEVSNGIGAHHDEVEMESLIAPIVQVCDAISGARPGARGEKLWKHTFKG